MGEFCQYRIVSFDEIREQLPVAGNVLKR